MLSNIAFEERKIIFVESFEFKESNKREVVFNLDFLEAAISSLKEIDKELRNDNFEKRFEKLQDDQIDPESGRFEI